MNMPFLDLDSSLFNIEIPTDSPGVGSLLVAEPFLRETYFNHAVILLIEYEKKGTAMGLVLNKPTNITLGEAVEGIDDDIDIPVYCGGPMSTDRLFFIHSLGNQLDGTRQITDKLYLGGDFEQVKEYISLGYETRGKIKFFIGYSGWSPQQLNDEIQTHIWAIMRSPSECTILNDSDESLWHNTVRSMGIPYKNWLYHPSDPQYN